MVKKITRVNLWLLSFITVIVAINAGGVVAQESLLSETVTGRARPELDPQGIRARGFLVFPRLKVGEQFDDNIFAVNSDEEESYVTVVEPGFSINSNWNNHALNFRADANIGRYLNDDDQNYQDFTVAADGRLDISRANELSAGISHARLHQDRGSPNEVNGVKPTVIFESAAFANYRHKINRMSFDLAGVYQNQDFEDVQGLLGTIDNDNRDRSEVNGSLKIGFEFLPEYSAFVRGSVNSRDYRRLCCGSNLFNRNSNGYEINLGVDRYQTGLLSGNVFIGYRAQNYSDSRLQSVQGFTGGGSLTWLPTGLTTVTGSVKREIAETIIGTAAGIFSTIGRISVDHELLRNLLLNVGLGIAQDDFEGADRDDTYVRVNFGANYMLNRYLHVLFDYNFTDRDSSAGDGINDFTRNTVRLGVQLQL